MGFLIVQLNAHHLAIYLVVKTTNRGGPLRCKRFLWNHVQQIYLYPYVFLAGLEEDLFPSRQSKDEPHLIDEERRLCYVGMTRAMKKLTMSFAIKRFLHGGNTIRVIFIFGLMKL
jgi:hypothetical protein